MERIAYWVTFENGQKGCVEAADIASALRTGADYIGKKAVSAERLPYPAVPRIGPVSDTPSFCYAPKDCVWHTSCPKNPACTE